MIVKCSYQPELHMWFSEELEELIIHMPVTPDTFSLLFVITMQTLKRGVLRDHITNINYNRLK